MLSFWPFLLPPLTSVYSYSNHSDPFKIHLVISFFSKSPIGFSSHPKKDPNSYNGLQGAPWSVFWPAPLPYLILLSIQSYWPPYTYKCLSESRGPSNSCRIKWLDDLGRSQVVVSQRVNQHEVRSGKAFYRVWLWRRGKKHGIWRWSGKRSRDRNGFLFFVFER